MTPEGLVQNKVCEYLNKKGVFFFRVNNTPQYDSKLNQGYGGYRAMSKWAMPGVPDIIAISEKGTFIGLEIKAAKGRLSTDQIAFRDRALRHNAEYHVIRTVDEVKTIWG